MTQLPGRISFRPVKDGWICIILHKNKYIIRFPGGVPDGIEKSSILQNIGGNVIVSHLYHAVGTVPFFCQISFVNHHQPRHN